MDIHSKMDASAEGRLARVYYAAAALWNAPRRLGVALMVYGMVLGGTVFALLALQEIITILRWVGLRGPEMRIFVDVARSIISMWSFVGGMIALKFVSIGLFVALFGDMLRRLTKRRRDAMQAKRNPRLFRIKRRLTQEEQRSLDRKVGACFTWAIFSHFWGYVVFMIPIPEGVWERLQFIVALLPLSILVGAIILWSLRGESQFFAVTEYARARGWTAHDISTPFLPRWLKRS